TASIHVNNVAPSASFNAPASVNEGSAIALSLTGVSDPSSGDTLAGFSYAFDCGSGSGYGAWSPTASASCPTTDSGSRTVKGEVKDRDGGISEYTASVTVSNVAPTPSITDAPASSPEGTTILLHSSVSDPSSVDTAAGFTYAWSVTKNGSAYGSNGSASTYSFTPTDNGSYVVTLKATDKDGGYSTTTATISVSNVGPTVAITGAPASATEDAT